jgi:hypothetical protein
MLPGLGIAIFDESAFRRFIRPQATFRAVKRERASPLVGVPVAVTRKFYCSIAAGVCEFPVPVVTKKSSPSGTHGPPEPPLGFNRYSPHELAKK